MLTRRSLFARLSAVALAPLVKLDTTRHQHQWSFLTPPDVRFYPFQLPERAHELHRLINNLMHKQRTQAEQNKLLAYIEEAKEKQYAQVSPVPQEEA